jgi:hypothetical protein
VLAQIFKYILPIIPVAGLALAAQALYAWLYPSEQISLDFFAVLSDFYVMELVFMHSTVFWKGRYYLLNGKQKKNRPNKDITKISRIKEIGFALFLFAAYSLFIIPLFQKNSFLAWNYVILNILRFFDTHKEPWYSDYEFYKAFDLSARPMLVAVIALLKLFVFALLLPLAVSAIPLPDFGLNADVVKSISSNHNDSFGIIILTKSMFFYFTSMALFDIWLFTKNRKIVRPYEHQSKI